MRFLFGISFLFPPFLYSFSSVLLTEAFFVLCIALLIVSFVFLYDFSWVFSPVILASIYAGSERFVHVYLVTFAFLFVLL